MKGTIEISTQFFVIDYILKYIHFWTLHIFFLKSRLDWTQTATRQASTTGIDEPVVRGLPRKFMLKEIILVTQIVRKNMNMRNFKILYWDANYSKGTMLL